MTDRRNDPGGNNGPGEGAAGGATATGAAARVVIVGGDAAGMSAASRVRRMAPEAEVVVLEQGPHISYAACGIPYLVSGVIDEPASLEHFTPEQAREKRGIDVRTGHQVTGLHLDERAISGVRSQPGEPFRLGYDHLVLATGARALVPPVPGTDLEGVFAVRSLAHGAALRRYLDERHPRRAVIVGAGFVGLELAESFRRRSMEVTLVDARSTPLLGLEAEIGAMLEERLVSRGCTFLRDAPLYEILGSREGKVAGVHAGGERLDTDLCVLGIGVRPESGLAERAGLTLGPAGAIRVDDRGATGQQRVWAGGDCATQRHRISETDVFVSQALGANRIGRVLGANIAREITGSSDPPERHPGTMGTFVLSVFDLEVGRTGLDITEARDAGMDPVVSTITASTQAAYMPGTLPLKVALVAERGTGRLLGGQIAGGRGAAKRVDTLATALHAGMDLATLADLDLGYTPALSPVWDPILMAARIAFKRTK